MRTSVCRQVCIGDPLVRDGKWWPGQVGRALARRAEVLDALGPQGILINVARGSLVNGTGLVAALVERRLAGAGLDAFIDEPNVPPALFALDSVVLRPHRASATTETGMAMEDLLLANLAAHFAGEPLPSAAV
jgi:lactate dehydrogenase-like 2-hydroxyacid dehydrogenase